MMDFLAPNYTAVFKQRADKLVQIRQNPEMLPVLMSYYKDNIADFICDWGMTSDPRNAERGLPVIIPFVLFDRQREFVDWLIERWHNQESGLVEKSRDMGLSWLCIAIAASLCLFHKDMSIGFGSRKEEYVDKNGDPKSLFHKARQFIDLLPPEFTNHWNERRNSKHMVVGFNNGSTLTGEAGDNIGRGNRTGIYFKDESAFYERPETIDAALSQTSNCKIDVSTPNGTGNPFYKKRMSGNIPVFTFRWQDDPRKDQAWYDKQVRELDPVTVAQEIDIDYTASIEGICIPSKYVRAAIELHKVLDLPATGAKRSGLDVADEEGKDFNAIAAVHGVVVGAMEEWNGVDTTQTTFKAMAFAEHEGSQYVNFDSIGVGAGVRGASKASRVQFNPVTVSSSPSLGSVLNNNAVINRDFYMNLRAQLWWEMRIRCERAYEHINDIKYWSLDEMVSLPNHPKLITELSQPLVEYTDSGKVKIESKKAMAKRGVASPNYAEAVLMAFAPIVAKARAPMTQRPNSKAWT